MAVRPGAICAALCLAHAPVLGCDREPVAVDCAGAGVGVVISEIRGPQGGTDGYGEWIELFNPTGDTIDLGGVKVTVTQLDGSSSSSFVLRGDAAAVVAGAFLVLGRFPVGQEPAHVDLGYAGAYDRALPRGAAIDLSSCGEVLDRVIYRSLPLAGTYAYDGGAFPPDSTSNDDAAAWCVDSTEDADTPQQGIRGTPGERNRPCA